jgi:hypothetical protein
MARLPGSPRISASCFCGHIARSTLECMFDPAAASGAATGCFLAKRGFRDGGLRHREAGNLRTRSGLRVVRSPRLSIIKVTRSSRPASRCSKLLVEAAAYRRPPPANRPPIVVAGRGRASAASPTSQERSCRDREPRVKDPVTLAADGMQPASSRVREPRRRSAQITVDHRDDTERLRAHGRS